MSWWAWTLIGWIGLNAARFVGALACGLVALNCVGKAIGAVPDNLFADGLQWIWWPVAATWVLWGVAVAHLTPKQGDGE